MSKQPLSVTEILAKQKEQASFKPRFLSKAEREKQAQQEQAKQEQERKQKLEAERQKREQFERAATAQSSSTSHRSYHSSQNGDHHSHRDSDLNYGYSDENGDARYARGERRRDDRYNVGTQRDRSARTLSEGVAVNRDGSTSHSDTNGNGNTGLTEFEQAQIRQRYLGIQADPSLASGSSTSAAASQQRKKRKLVDRKFNFEWDESDDTASSSLLSQILPMTSQSSGSSNSTALPSSSSLMERKKLEEKHWSSKTLAEMKERDWRIFREDFGIAARGGQIPKPLRSWKESEIPRSILSVIEEIGYKDPSPIQRQAIPIGLQNRDLIGIAETGSGKTASFLVPMLSYIISLPKLNDEVAKSLGPYALILVPTRELAQQIESETNKFASRLGFTCVSIVGGRDMNDQAYSLRDGAEIVIATPGRLKDCLERHILVLSQCTYVVMDEADKMVDMGFEPQVNYILDSLPVSNLKPDDVDHDEEAGQGGTGLNGNSARIGKYRVTMLYSATMPPSVERMARTYLRKPATITIGDAGQAVASVEQNIEFVTGEESRKSTLLAILTQSRHLVPIIVFVNQKKAADMVSTFLTRSGFAVSTLHSGKVQEQRESALLALREGQTSILVATDLAGRGIDIPNIGLVINYHMSNNIEAYVHRIGRTGRAGKKGTAITFIDKQTDADILYDLRVEIAKSKISKVPPELARLPAAQQKPLRDAKRKVIQEMD